MKYRISGVATYQMDALTGEYFVYIGDDEPPAIEVKEGPEVPWPCWDQRPVDPNRAIDAVRAMCKGGGMSTKEKT